MSGLFITGVGTGVGKTLVTTILCHQLREMDRPVIALKPVVSGYVEGDPESDPALILQSLAVAHTAAAIAAIAPWRFAAPLSPHIAARREGRSVSRAEVARFCREQSEARGSIRLIEGAGGVMSPMTSDATCLDLILDIGDPVVLVTGTYLGALSHTLTALTALRERAVPLRGIVVSESADGVGLADTVEGLREFGAGDRPIHLLHRLPGEPRGRWRGAPLLTGICEPDHA
jgi:dethiobiotin synthetase